LHDRGDQEMTIVSKRLAMEEGRRGNLVIKHNNNIKHCSYFPTSAVDYNLEIQFNAQI